MITFPLPSQTSLIDQPPRCRQCAYILTHLEVARCPECGTQFDPEIESTYLRHPGFVFWKFWLPGFLLAVGGGVLLCVLFLSANSLGWGLAIGCPFTLGGLLGYGIRAPIWWSIILALAALTVIVTMLIMASLAGLFCGVILVLLFFVPTFFGLAVGRLLRAALKESTFSQRWYLPVVAFLLLPGVVHAAEKIIGFSHPPETVETSAVLPVNLHRAWSCHLFGRDTRPDAAAAMKLGLPRPTTMPNEHFLLGTEQKIKFNKGELTIRVTQRVEDSLLGFDYIRQSHVEDRAVRLLDGQWKFAQVAPGQTRVTIRTRYQPLMTPRWAWRPLERMSGNATHEYLLEEMRQAAADPATRAAP